MVSREFNIGPRYLPYVPGINPERHRFQLEISNCSDQSESCLIVEAPTGAGKTKALSDLARNYPSSLSNPVTLIVSPTNALASQTVNDILQQAPELSVARWTADQFMMNGVNKNLEMINQCMTKRVIVSNPDMVHLFTQNFYSIRGGHRQSNQTFEQGMSRFGVHVFDEYHAYDERMLASVLSYMIKAREFKSCGHHKYVFMSATPNDDLITLLDKFDFSYKVVTEKETIVDDGQSRMIKGPLKINVSTVGIDQLLHFLPDSGEASPRCLIVFDSFAKQHMILNSLLNGGYSLYPEGNVASLTGRDTKSEHGQMPWEEATIILATSKVDLGLNIDHLDRLIMEPGWITTQFHQRFGRAGRQRPCDVIISIPEEGARILETAPDSNLAGLNFVMERLTRTRSFSVEKVEYYIGFQIGACEHNLNKPGLNELIRSISLPQRSAYARKCVRELQRLVNEFDINDKKAIDKIVNRLIESFSMIRGESIEVECTYDRGGQEFNTKENLIYIFSKTKSEKTAGLFNRYRILEFLEKPKDVNLTYPSLDNPILIQVSGGNLNEKVFRTYVRRLEEDLIQSSITGKSTDTMDALHMILTNIELDQLPPLEVMPDDQFI